MTIEVGPDRLPDRGRSPWQALAGVVALLLAVVALGLLGRHPAESAPRATAPPVAAATAVGPAPTPSRPAAAALGTAKGVATPSLAPDVAPAGPLALAAVSASELWASSYAGWPDGLWHYVNGVWGRVSVADWPRSTGIVGLAVAADGTLAADTDLGVAVLRDGRWTTLTDVAATMTVDPLGVIWLIQPSPSAQGAVVSSFRRDGTDWRREDLPVAPVGFPTSFAVGGRGDVWIGAQGFWGPPGGLAHFDGSRWTLVTLEGPTPPGVYALALAPDGDLWATVNGGPPSDAWAVAHRHGSDWSISPIPEGVHPDGDPTWMQSTLPGSSLSFALDGSLLVTARDALWRFDGTSWTIVTDAGTGRPLQVATLSRARDGTVWGWGSSGIVRIPSEGAAP